MKARKKPPTDTDAAADAARLTAGHHFTGRVCSCRTSRLAPCLPCLAHTRWRGIIESWGAIQWGLGQDRTDDGWGLEFQVEGVRALAEFLRVPYLAALLLNNEVSPEDIAEWTAWSTIERDALLTVKAQALAEKWDNRECEQTGSTLPGGLRRPAAGATITPRIVAAPRE